MLNKPVELQFELQKDGARVFVDDVREGCRDLCVSGGACISSFVWLFVMISVPANFGTRQNHIMFLLVQLTFHNVY